MHRVIEITSNHPIDSARTVHQVYLETTGLAVGDVAYLKRIAFSGSVAVVAVQSNDASACLARSSGLDAAKAAAALANVDDRLHGIDMVSAQGTISCEYELVDGLRRALAHDAAAVYVVCKGD